MSTLGQPEVGLVRYDAMCQAIAACYDIDEAKEIRNRAMAAECYARQANNKDAERKCGEIRIRAQRRVGELLIEMKSRGERATQKDGTPSREARLGKTDAPTPARTLADLGVTKDQSSHWQQLAMVPKEDFEKALSAPGPIPSADGLINAHVLRTMPPIVIPPLSLRLYGYLLDFGERGLLDQDPNGIVIGMNDAMRESCLPFVPVLIAWLQQIEASYGNFGGTTRRFNSRRI